jgi:TatD DNase family protein
MIFETHCHLDYLKEKSLDDILGDASLQGIKKIVTISVDTQNIHTVAGLADKYENVYFTQGIHPHDAKDMTDETLQTIKDRSSHPKMVAVGEIGLDYYYNHSPPEIQRQRFEEQLSLAATLKKPVVIHSRDADDDMIAILKNHAAHLPFKGVIHSFSSTLTLAEKSLELGFYLGFNGMVTFKKAQNVTSAVELCPLDRLLFETDSPFLTPVPHRGKENNPSFLPFIVAQIAGLKKIELEVLKKTVWDNSMRFFNLKN